MPYITLKGQGLAGLENNRVVGAKGSNTCTFGGLNVCDRGGKVDGRTLLCDF